MPEYLFERDGKEWTQWMTISERTKFLEENPDVTQLVNGFPSDGDSVKLGRTKTDDSFNDLLKQIKKNNVGSTIQTR